mgnify:CR=1 FL=1
MSTPDSIRVQPGAANYFSHPGALDRIEQFHPVGTLQRVLWIGGKRAQAAAVPYLPALFNAPCSIRETFSGHCSESAVSRYVGIGHGTDLIVGLGGGSVLDTAKAVAHRLGKPFIAIPTIAATCAAWTPLSVWYDDSGRALGYELFPLGSQLVLVEPRILAAAPADARFFAPAAREGHALFDLAGYIAMRLEAAGLTHDETDLVDRYAFYDLAAEELGDSLDRTYGG